MDENTLKAIKAKNEKVKEPEFVGKIDEIPGNENPFQNKKQNEKQDEKQDEKVQLKIPSISEKEAILSIHGKKVHYFPWTGKTKKKLIKSFENINSIEEIDLKEILKILVRDQLKEKDIYLSGDEQQYLITLLYKDSVSNDIKVLSECPNCLNEVELNTTIDESVDYTPSKYPYSIDFMGGVDFVDIGTFSELEKAIKNVFNDKNYDGITSEADIELAMHIRFLIANDLIKNIEIIDNLSIKDLNFVIEEHEKVSPKFVSKIVKVCPHCGKEGEFEVNHIPTIMQEFITQ